MRLVTLLLFMMAFPSLAEHVETPKARPVEAPLLCPAKAMATEESREAILQVFYSLLVLQEQCFVAGKDFGPFDISDEKNNKLTLSLLKVIDFHGQYSSPTILTASFLGVSFTSLFQDEESMASVFIYTAFYSAGSFAVGWPIRGSLIDHLEKNSAPPPEFQSQLQEKLENALKEELKFLSKNLGWSAEQKSIFLKSVRNKLFTNGNKKSNSYYHFTVPFDPTVRISSGEVDLIRIIEKENLASPEQIGVLKELRLWQKKAANFVGKMALEEAKAFYSPNEIQENIAALKALGRSLGNQLRENRNPKTNTQVIELITTIQENINSLEKLCEL